VNGVLVQAVRFHRQQVARLFRDSITVTVQKVDAVTGIVQDVQITGEQTDLYDWNFYVHDWDLKAQKVQACYPTMFGGTRGRVYRSRVNLDGVVPSVIGYQFQED